MGPRTAAWNWAKSRSAYSFGIIWSVWAGVCCSPGSLAVLVQWHIADARAGLRRREMHHSEDQACRSVRTRQKKWAAASLRSSGSCPSMKRRGQASVQAATRTLFVSRYRPRMCQPAGLADVYFAIRSTSRKITMISSVDQPSVPISMSSIRRRGMTSSFKRADAESHRGAARSFVGSNSQLPPRSQSLRQPILKLLTWKFDRDLRSRLTHRRRAAPALSSPRKRLVP